MEIIHEIAERRSVRKYKSDPVDEKDILQIIEAARLAPSGSNTQSWRFIIVKDENTKAKIAEADHHQKWMLSAPIFIVCIADISSRIEDYQTLELDETSSSPELKLIIRDTAIAISYMLLEAEHIGLDTCWTGWYDQKEMKRVLGLPNYMYVSGIVTVGYGDEKPNQRPRKSMNEILRYEK